MINNKGFCSVKSPLEKGKDQLQSETIFVKHNSQRIIIQNMWRIPVNKKEKEQEIYSRHKPSCERGTGMANIYEYVYVKTHSTLLLIMEPQIQITTK